MRPELPQWLDTDNQIIDNIINNQTELLSQSVLSASDENNDNYGK